MSVSQKNRTAAKGEKTNAAEAEKSRVNAHFQDGSGAAQPDGSAVAAAISYEDLYRRWEQGNWRSTEIDFSRDREGWQTLSEIQRRSALWIYSMFFYGEDSVTDNLSPYIDAAPKEEQKYFLATQQVDEARHAVFF